MSICFVSKIFVIIFFYFKFLTVVVTKYLKTIKKWTEAKNESLQYGLRRRKWKYSRFPSFRFLPHNQNRKLKTLRIVFLPQILTLVVTQDFKTSKQKTNELRQKPKTSDMI